MIRLRYKSREDVEPQQSGCSSANIWRPPTGAMRWVVVVVSLALMEASAVDVSCKNDSNKNVDWFILYKAPAAVSYIYIDAAGKKKVTSSIADGALVHTLRPMLGSVRNMEPSFGFLSYSDQPPGASAQPKEFGHSKGVVLGDSSTGTALWLTHSQPQFPFRRDQNNFWPPSKDLAMTKGQTFLCVSLPFSALSTVGSHLQNIRAYPFDHDLPIGFPKELTDAAKWVTSNSLLGKFQTVKTRGKKELRSMAKPRGYDAGDGDLYVQLAAALNSDLEAQTWGGQPQRDDSFCDTDKRHVITVEDIRTELETWSTKQDHSKWAVTTKKNIAWTCFGDVNRSCSQYQRWGGALCINDRDVNTFFKGFVKKQGPCRKRPCPSSERISEIEALVENLEKLEL